MSESVSEFLTQVQLSSREVFVSSPNATAAEAFKTLADKEVYSVPVVTKKGQCKGFIDWLDILAHLVIVSGERKRSLVTPASRSLTSDDVSLLMERANESTLKDVKQRKVANSKNGTVPFLNVKSTDKLNSVIKLLSKGHHVGVLAPGDSKVLVNVISQMDVIRWLASDSERSGSVGRKSVKGNKLHSKRVFCVRSDDIAIDAFFSLWKQNISGAAVIDREGKLVGNLATSALKELAEFNFSLLLKPVKEWIGDEQPTVVHEYDSLNEVLHKMVSAPVHRVYVVAPGGYPQGVITTTDVLRVLKPKKKAKDKKKQKK